MTLLQAGPHVALRLRRRTLVKRARRERVQQGVEVEQLLAARAGSACATARTECPRRRDHRVEKVEERRRIAVVDLGHDGRSELGVDHIGKEVRRPAQDAAQELGESEDRRSLPYRCHSASQKKSRGTPGKAGSKARSPARGIPARFTDLFCDGVQARQKPVKLAEQPGRDLRALFDRRLQSRHGRLSVSPGQFLDDLVGCHGQRHASWVVRFRPGLRATRRLSQSRRRSRRLSHERGGMTTADREALAGGPRCGRRTPGPAAHQPHRRLYLDGIPPAHGEGFRPLTAPLNSYPSRKVRIVPSTASFGCPSSCRHPITDKSSNTATGSMDAASVAFPALLSAHDPSLRTMAR